MNALEIKNFSKNYGSKKAVDDISLTIPEGEFFGLLGNNGAGKTTTIQAVTGIGKFSTGTINVFGVDVQKDYRAARAMIGLSPQEYNFDIFAPAEVTMDYNGGYFGMPKAARQKRIAELFKIFELEEHRGKPFQSLSGGLKRRATLARALMHDPRLLILDEPTAGIDVEQRHMLWKYLRDLHKAGKTIILTSHYLEEVELLCSRVAIMHQGKIIKIMNRKEFAESGRKLEHIYLEATGSMTKRFEEK